MRRKTPQALYVGTNRFVAALDPKTGDEFWRTKLPHSSSFGAVVTILIKDDLLYVGHGGRAYCLSRADGSIIWENGLPKMGYYPVLMAMEGAQGISSPDAVAAYALQRSQDSSYSAGT